MTKLTWKTVRVKLGDLKEWDKNPVQISERDAKELAKSLSKFDHVLPYVAAAPKNGHGLPLLDGHQRKMVEIQLNKVSPSTLVDVRIPSRKLTEKERQEIVIRLRKNTGAFDFDKLANFFDVPDLLEWGFTEKELQLGGFDMEQETKDAEPQIDRAAELLKKWKVKTGDLWQIGDHRLICGDCTDAAVVARVMGGEKAGTMFSDPPYNVEMKATRKDRNIQEIENDNLSDDDFREFVLSFLKVAKENVTDEVYVCCDWRNDHIFKACMKEVGWQPKCEIVWDKETRAQNLNKWAFAHEFILYHGYFGTPTIDTNVWRMKREYSDVHLTPKPIELIEKALSAGVFEIAYDPFSGTGSTMVACQNLGRRCRAVEKKPAYVAVALQRMNDAFPNLPIEKVKDGKK